MTQHNHMLDPKFSLQTKTSAALVEWLGGHIQEQRGGGWDVRVKGVRLRAGYDGNWRLGTFGVSAAAVGGLGMAVYWASGGQVSVPWWQTVMIMPFAVATAESMKGAGSAFSAAREKGASPFKAFSALCKRARVGLTSKTPNPMIVPMLAIGGVLTVATKLKNVSAIKGPGGKMNAWAQAAELKAFAGGRAAVKVYEAVEHWKVCSLVRASALESRQSQGQSIYGEMALEFMAQRIGLSGAGALPGALREALLADQSKAEQALADKCGPYLTGYDVTAEKLDVLMLRADVAGVPPWHRPEPGVPTLCELAASLAQWSEASNQDVSESLSARLDGWAARCEAQELRAHVGIARPAKTGLPMPTRKRL